jgi:hypothetical protein
MTVAPGTSASVELVLDLTARTMQETSQSERSFSVTVRPYLEGADSEHAQWTVSGTVRSHFVLEPPVVDLGTDVVSGKPSGPFRLKVTTREPVPELSAVVTPPVASATVKRISANRFVLTLTPNSKLPLGPLNAEVILQASRDSVSRTFRPVLPGESSRL